MSIGSHLRLLVQRELATREDELARAKIEFSRGLMTAEELKDYEDDVAFEKSVQQKLHGVFGAL